MTKATLLVVEDEPNLLLGIRDILELDNYYVMTAQNGQQALDVLQKSAEQLPDLIVSDIMMPYMDGIELLQEVRNREQWVTIPFIFLTAKGEKSDIQRGRRLGVDDYLVKPFDADDLLVAVDAKLRRHQAISRVHAGAVSNIKRNILTILNHEFRTPLTLVVAYADMLKENNVEAMNEEELLLFLREINSGADRLRRLIENFILLVELETGDAQKTFAWRKHKITDMETLVKAAYNQVMESDKVLHTGTLKIHEPLPHVIGDRDYLVVIMRELVDNAVKFSTPDKPVRVEAEAVNGDLHVRVIDQGRGIPEAEREMIWDTFYQIDRDTFEDQGAGSGLAIVKGLVSLHEGARVDIQSLANEGSTFTLVLPSVKDH